MTKVLEESVHDSATTNVQSKNTRRSVCAQLVATLIQCSLLVGIGMQYTIPTLVIGALHNHPEEKLNMNNDQASWFGSLPAVAQFIASFLTGFLQDRFGRKGSMVLVNIPILASWLTLYFANSIGALYVAAVIMGLCGGLCEAPLHSYVGEIGEPHVRGTLSTLSTSSLGVSATLMFFVGYLFDWRTTALICTVESVITFILMTQIPESPMWLISKNRLGDAKKSLSWLRGWVKPEEVQDEFMDLVRYTKNSTKPEEPLMNKHDTDLSNGKAEQPVSQKDSYLKTKFKEITNKKVLRPLRLVMTMFTFYVCSSLYGLNPYMIGILDSLGSPVDSKLILVISSLLALLGLLLNMIFLRRLGKRKIVLFAQTVITVSILIIAICCSFFLKPKETSSLSWIPVLLILNITLLSAFGLGPLCWQLLSEVFPPAGRGTACGLLAAWAQIVKFAFSKSYLYIEEMIKFSGTMYLCGIVSIYSMVYIYYNVPETEGKSLEQIESYFTKNHDRKEKFSMGKQGVRPIRKSLNRSNQQMVVLSPENLEP